MTENNSKPVVFLAFANDQEKGERYLRQLRNEADQLRDLLEAADDVCQVVVRQNATLDNILDIFQSPQYKHRIAIFHFGGHANSYQLLLESPKGKTVAADAGGLAAFLAQQRGLHLVFLNGCATHQQVEGLLAAGVKAVIATGRKIADDTAVNFAVRFYKGLLSGQGKTDGLQSAFAEAEGAAQTAIGDNPRDAYLADEETDEPLAPKWPWGLYLADTTEDEAEYIATWNLWRAADNPYFGLPALPKRPLPAQPFLGLNYFREKHAEIFFGRGHQIRRLFLLITDEAL